MLRFAQKYYRRLTAAVSVLFILELISLPFALRLTYAGRSEAPEHNITYTSGRLSWDSGTKTDTNGAALLSVFNSEYENVKADNGDRVVAPGTEESCIIRLKNSSPRAVKYTAVLYYDKTTEKLPIEVVLDAENAQEASDYRLPEGIDKSLVSGAVTGTVSTGEIADFDIGWIWDFEQDAVRDLNDTELGNLAARLKADRITAGFYIVVEDGGELITPDLPQTGDRAMLAVIIGLLAVSGSALIILLIYGRRRNNGDS
ncbi:MAG: LPXTG cell wall anchor domain-containing protein [Acutalibacteraceae bacterium]